MIEIKRLPDPNRKWKKRKHFYHKCSQCGLGKRTVEHLTIESIILEWLKSNKDKTELRQTLPDLLEYIEDIVEFQSPYEMLSYYRQSAFEGAPHFMGKLTDQRYILKSRVSHIKPGSRAMFEGIKLFQLQFSNWKDYNLIAIVNSNYIPTSEGWHSETAALIFERGRENDINLIE